MQVPIDYEKKFKLAELAFMHQKVYDIDEQVLVPLSPLTAEDAEFAADYIGWYVKGRCIRLLLTNTVTCLTT